MRGRLSGSFSAPTAASVRGIPGRAVGWFRDLSSVPKLLLVGLVLLALFVVLSPVVRVVAIVAFVVSVAVLIVRGGQRRIAWRWGIAAVASLALIPIFGGLSGVLYGSSETASGSGPTGAEPTVVSAPGLPITTSAPPSSTSPSSTSPSSSATPDSLYDITPSSGVPYYEVSTAMAVAGACSVDVQMETEFERYREDTDAVFNDIATQTEGSCGYVDVTVASLNEIEVETNGVPFSLPAGPASLLASGTIYHEDGTYSIEYKWD